jgi:hypothetical protein
MYHAPVFPPNRKETVARLSEPDRIEHLEEWTCDQAAQFLSGISGDGFNQADVDNFEFFSGILKSCLLRNSIASCEIEGEKYLVPISVVEWAISKSYELPTHVLAWYEKQRNQLNQIIDESAQMAEQGLSSLLVKDDECSETPAPWLISDPKDPVPEQPWYIPARYFARQLVKDDSTLLTKRNVLVIKVAQSLDNVGIKKRGGKKPFNPGTIKKALSNINLS